MTEEEKRDAALALLARTRQELIKAARISARRIYRYKGSVSSTDVFELMESNPYWAAKLAGVDRRFMGAVFGRSSGWVRVGWEMTGSHARPVAIWGRES